jgi:ferredoxin-nitrite reductase
VDVRLKWSGLFHRRKRTPGRFMMRLKVPNGELTAAQLRYLGDCIAPYGADGCADITTRANMQVCWVCWVGLPQTPLSGHEEKEA